MGIPYVLVWDLDDTLGDFYPLQQHRDADTAVTVKTRPGMAAALEALSRAGFTHSLLTMATPAYAEMALRGSRLRDYFARVEGRGQRWKGDAQGVADVFGIPEDEVAARVLFVGDRMVFDEPRDPRVVFHLEPFALGRPAGKLERLVLHLRAAGNGSLRRGFDALHAGDRRWYRLWRRCPRPVGKPTSRSVPGLGPVLLLGRPAECPVIAFGTPPTSGAIPDEHRFYPDRVATTDPSNHAATEVRAD